MNKTKLINMSDKGFQVFYIDTEKQNTSVTVDFGDIPIQKQINVLSALEYFIENYTYIEVIGIMKL